MPNRTLASNDKDDEERELRGAELGLLGLGLLLAAPLDTKRTTSGPFFSVDTKAAFGNRIARG